MTERIALAAKDFQHKAPVGVDRNVSAHFCLGVWVFCKIWRSRLSELQLKLDVRALVLLSKSDDRRLAKNI
jgi:hypothetical protein